MLNAFGIPYRVLHDDDAGNPNGNALNARIAAALPATPGHVIHMIGPTDFEGLLGYAVAGRTNKPFAAVKQVEQLHAAGALPPAFVEAMNMAYFGHIVEPAAN